MLRKKNQKYVCVCVPLKQVNDGILIVETKESSGIARSAADLLISCIFDTKKMLLMSYVDPPAKATKTKHKTTSFL